MKSWIARTESARSLEKGDLVNLEYADITASVYDQDTMFLVDKHDPTLLFARGIAVEVSTEERRVIGDDEEANSWPYPTYDLVTIIVRCEEVFELPLSLAAYLSSEDFETYEDEYRNEYGGVLQELPSGLASKLNKAMSNRNESGAPVFLSYAREDVEIALQLHKRLTEKGVHVWLDKISLSPGENWKLSINRAIRGSRAFIALLSSNSINKRGYVQKELRLGLDILEELPPSNIYLIPVRIEECIPDHEALKDLNWVDLFPDFNVGCDKIAVTLSNI